MHLPFHVANTIVTLPKHIQKLTESVDAPIITALTPFIAAANIETNDLPINKWLGEVLSSLGSLEHGSAKEYEKVNVNTIDIDLFILFICAVCV